MPIITSINRAQRIILAAPGQQRVPQGSPGAGRFFRQPIPLPESMGGPPLVVQPLPTPPPLPGHGTPAPQFLPSGEIVPPGTSPVVGPGGQTPAMRRLIMNAIQGQIAAGGAVPGESSLMGGPGEAFRHVTGGRGSPPRFTFPGGHGPASLRTNPVVQRSLIARILLSKPLGFLGRYLTGIGPIAGTIAVNEVLDTSQEQLIATAVRGEPLKFNITAVGGFAGVGSIAGPPGAAVGAVVGFVYVGGRYLLAASSFPDSLPAEPALAARDPLNLPESLRQLQAEVARAQNIIDELTDEQLQAILDAPVNVTGPIHDC